MAPWPCLSFTPGRYHHHASKKAGILLNPCQSINTPLPAVNKVPSRWCHLALQHLPPYQHANPHMSRLRHSFAAARNDPGMPASLPAAQHSSGREGSSGKQGPKDSSAIDSAEAMQAAAPWSLMGRVVHSDRITLGLRPRQRLVILAAAQQLSISPADMEMRLQASSFYCAQILQSIGACRNLWVRSTH